MALAQEEIEEIVVTGSYIRGSAKDAPSPVQSSSREGLVASGVSDVAEMIRNLEIASGSDTAPQNETRFNDFELSANTPLYTDYEWVEYRY